MYNEQGYAERRPTNQPGSQGIHGVSAPILPGINPPKRDLFILSAGVTWRLSSARANVASANSHLPLRILDLQEFWFVDCERKSIIRS